MNTTFFPNSLYHKDMNHKMFSFYIILQVCNTKIVQQHKITTMHVFPNLLVEICYLFYMLLKIYTKLSNKTTKAIWIYSSLVKEPSFYFVFTYSNNTWKIYKPIESHIWSIKHSKRLFLVPENKVKRLEKRERKLFSIYGLMVLAIFLKCVNTCNQNTDNTSRLNLIDLSHPTHTSNSRG